MENVNSYLSIRNLNKSFGKFLALDDVSIDISPGELSASLVIRLWQDYVTALHCWLESNQVEQLFKTQK